MSKHQSKAIRTVNQMNQYLQGRRSSGVSLFMFANNQSPETFVNGKVVKDSSRVVHAELAGDRSRGVLDDWIAQTLSENVLSRYKDDHSIPSTPITHDTLGRVRMSALKSHDKQSVVAVRLAFD